MKGAGIDAMTLIRIPDDQAAALQSRAAAQGLTLEAWLQRLAGFGEARRNKERCTLAELVAQCDPDSPLSEEDRVWLDAPDVGREAV
jgi:antitoxin component of MazEF toxin-antitoxin module